MDNKEMNNPPTNPASLPASQPPIEGEILKSRRSMSIQSICDPLASSTVSISDHDSEITLVMNERMSFDGGDIANLDSLSPSEEQAVRALEELGQDTTLSSPQQGQLLNRVQNYSIVNSAVKVWDQGKNYNRALKWGGEMVESVVGGVVQRLEPLEPFAVRQLDRFESYKYPSPEKSPNGTAPLPPPTPSAATASASRWQNVLISTGGLTASISEQSLASLIFCLRWLRVATSHLSNSINSLEKLLSPSSRRAADEESLSAASHSTRIAIGSRIEKIKQEIVDTLRKAVDVVSRHAGAALPEPARSRVKVYILSLPARWQAASSPVQSPRLDGGATGTIGSNGLTREEETGWRVLTLASESLQMLSGVMNIVDDTLQSAEEWAATLRRNRRNPGTGLTTPDMTPNEEKPKEEDENAHRNMQVDGL